MLQLPWSGHWCTASFYAYCFLFILFGHFFILGSYKSIFSYTGGPQFAAFACSSASACSLLLPGQLEAFYSVCLMTDNSD